MTDRMMVIYCPVSAAPRLAHVTEQALSEMVGAPNAQQIGIMPGIALIYDAAQAEDPDRLNRNIRFSAHYGNAVYIWVGRRITGQVIRKFRSLTQDDLIRLGTRGYINLDELTGAQETEVLSV